VKNKLECQICKERFKTIQSLIGHVTNEKYHKISIKEYYDLYFKIENEEICERENCNNITRFQSFSNGYGRFCSHKCSNISVKRKHTISKRQKEQHSKFMKDLWTSKECPYKKESVKNIKSNTMKKHWSNKNSKLNSLERSKKISKKQKKTWQNDKYRSTRSENMKILRNDNDSIFNSKEYIKKHKKSYTEKVKRKISNKVKEAWEDNLNKLGDKKWCKKRRDYMKNGGAAHCNKFIKNPSKPQVELFNICQKIFPYPIMNYPSCGYSIDIAIPCLNMAIEYDGSYWHKDKEYDQKRQITIENDGWICIRYTDFVPSEEELFNDVCRRL
jgi:hypothetical protein